MPQKGRQSATCYGKWDGIATHPSQQITTGSESTSHKSTSQAITSGGLPVCVSSLRVGKAITRVNWEFLKNKNPNLMTAGSSLLILDSRPNNCDSLTGDADLRRMADNRSALHLKQIAKSFCQNSRSSFSTLLQG